MRSHERLKGLGFRGRLFAFLLAFALVPSILVLLTWATLTRLAAPYVGAPAPWDSVAASGQRAIDVARRRPGSAAARAALDEHEAQLNRGLLMARRTNSLAQRVGSIALLATVVSILLFGLLAARAAGHLSRNMSRPISELVEWTDLIGRGEPLPTGPPRKGAPEFQLLRHRMQRMAAEIRSGRERAVEAERAAALRESARQVAHELKNPLTPIRFAVSRLRRHATPETADAIDVLDVETARLDAMARSFSQFGRLPEGPSAAIDLGELARYAARSGAAPGMAIDVTVDPATPMIDGHYDALARALSNVVLNAVDACQGSGTITLTVAPTMLGDRPAAEVQVRDSGPGIDPARLPTIFEPYVTTKAGGTGLGLAIVRQTLLAHEGVAEARSAPGGGTTIRLAIPVVRTPVAGP